jgi:hypothetical protein
MRKEDDSRTKRACPSREPIRLRARPVFDAGCLRAAGFPPEDISLRNWPGLWDRWLSAARADLIFLPPRTLLLTELPAFAEEETDAHFRASPFLGYAHDVLARTLCRDLLSAALDETVACAPFPRLSPDERSALVRLGILAPGRPFPMLLRRYAILTLRPPAQGCADCALSADCPKRPLS